MLRALWILFSCVRTVSGRASRRAGEHASMEFDGRGIGPDLLLLLKEIIIPQCVQVVKA